MVIAGELIEHLDQPGLFLQHTADLMNAGTELIITVPNAFSAKSFLRVLLGREKVSADHVAYYSLINLQELASRCQLEVTQVRWYRSSFVTHPAERLVDGLLWPLLTLRPQMSDGIIVVCRKVADRAEHRDCTNDEIVTDDRGPVELAGTVSQL